MSVVQAENQLKYTEAEMDCIIEREEATEREKVRLEYADKLALLTQEYADIAMHGTDGKEDMQCVVEQNFQSDSCFNELELREHRNVLTEFQEYEAGVVECHEQLKQQRVWLTTSTSQDSLQSLSSSFEELQQRYKKLKGDCMKNIDTLEEALKVKSKLEKLNEQLQAKVQGDLSAMEHFVYEVDLQYTSLQKKLASDLAIEKATAKRIGVELSSLEKSVHQMETEKLQLQQFCDDLMKELGSR